MHHGGEGGSRVLLHSVGGAYRYEKQLHSIHQSLKCFYLLIQQLNRQKETRPADMDVFAKVDNTDVRESAVRLGVSPPPVLGGYFPFVK